MIALLIHNGKRVAIGEAADMIYKARAYIGATVVRLDGRLASTCEAFNAETLFAQNRGNVRVPRLMSFETVQCGQYN